MSNICWKKKKLFYSVFSGMEIKLRCSFVSTEIICGQQPDIHLSCCINIVKEKDR